MHLTGITFPVSIEWDVICVSPGSSEKRSPKELSIFINSDRCSVVKLVSSPADFESKACFCLYSSSFQNEGHVQQNQFVSQYNYKSRCLVYSSNLVLHHEKVQKSLIVRISKYNFRARTKHSLEYCYFPAAKTSMFTC